MCPVGISLELGFGQGPGGSEAAAHAALMGLRFHRRSEPVLFRRCLPGMATLEMVNRIRTAIMENWDWLRMFDRFFFRCSTSSIRNGGIEWEYLSKEV